MAKENKYPKKDTSLNKINESSIAYSVPIKREQDNKQHEYLTSDEFWEKVEEKRKNFCSKHGIV
ncbi:MAG: hypothetical protein Q4G63_12990 [Bacteroidia bacterium]|nr:hypothetical protein [Bacteroidia bacterium]